MYVQDLQETSPTHSAESGVVSLGMRRLHGSTSDFKGSPPYVPLGDENKDESHMDDLLFMLKTQNYSPASVNSDDSDQRFQHNTSAGTEHFERRRISIADTHL